MNHYVPADIIIYNIKQDFILKERSLIAVEEKSGKIIAVGNEVEYTDYDSMDVICISPFHFGAVEDFVYASAIMKELIRKAFGKSLRKPSLVLCVPQQLGEVEKKVYEEIFAFGIASKVKVYGGTRESFLQSISDKESRLWDGIVEIGKDNLEEYAKELVLETQKQLKNWGFSIEQILEEIS